MKKGIWIRSKTEAPFSVEIAQLLRTAFLRAGLAVKDSCSADVDLVVAIGGDGTLLATVRDMARHRHLVPILGVHSSRGRGFLYAQSIPHVADREGWAEDLAQALKKAEYRLSPRWGLDGQVKAAAGTGGAALEVSQWALNDFVITKGALSRMVDLRVTVNGEVMFKSMRGDGLIVSSPTGSTAYAFSAGGPVVDPSLRTIQLTPICPHDLMDRSVVISGDAEVGIEVLCDKGPAFLTVDGQEGFEMPTGSTLSLKPSREPVVLMEPLLKNFPSRSYYEQLRIKLGFGGSGGN